jgi:glycosyltransferase involved in cell wall biosynthesis
MLYRVSETLTPREGRASIVHLSTVHPRSDIRICNKEVATLHRRFGDQVAAMFADGLGDSRVAGSAPIYDLGVLSGRRFKRALFGTIRAWRRLRHMKAQVVHFHDPELIPLGLALRAAGARVIYDVHEDVPQQIMSKHWIPFYLRRPVALAMLLLESIAGKAFDAIVAATPAIGARFPAHKTIVVQNFPIQSEFMISEPSNDDQRSTDFCYVGGIFRVRGAFEMVDALSILRRERHDVRLTLAGSFSPSELESDLKSMSGWNFVDYRGFVGRREIADILKGSVAGLVVLHPTRAYVESYPVKMFEYMAAGIPVIASDFPIWRSIVCGANCGLLVDPKKPEAIAGAMKWMLENRSEALEMGRRGKVAVQQTYNWDQEGKKLDCLYETLSASFNLVMTG